MNALDRLGGYLLGADNAGDDAGLRAAYVALARAALVRLERDVTEARGSVEAHEKTVKGAK